MNSETLDYECNYCSFKAKTPTEIWVHECDGKRKAAQLKKQAIKMGQELGNAVVVSQ